MGNIVLTREKSMRNFFKNWVFDVLLFVLAVCGIAWYLQYRVGAEKCQLELSRWAYSLKTGDFTPFYAISFHPVPPKISFAPGQKKQVYTITDAATRKELQQLIAIKSLDTHYNIKLTTKKFLGYGCKGAPYYKFPKLPEWVLESCQPICIIHPTKKEILSVTRKEYTANELAGVLEIYKDW